MNKKIKIIDFANKLRNPIEMPKRVKYKDKIYTYDEQRNNYYYCDHQIYIGECLKDILNDEVEILEDNTEEIEELHELPEWGFDDDDIKNKINEIIRYIKRKEKE